MNRARRGATIIGLMIAIVGAAAAQDAVPNTVPKSTVEYSVESVKAGKKAYLRLCQYCHGQDGRAQANPDFDAPNLRRPQEWRNGTADDRVFLSLRDGFGHEMPPFKSKLTDEQIWQVVHFVRSIGPAKYLGQIDE